MCSLQRRFNCATLNHSVALTVHFVVGDVHIGRSHGGGQAAQRHSNETGGEGEGEHRAGDRHAVDAHVHASDDVDATVHTALHVQRCGKTNNDAAEKKCALQE